MRVQHFMYGGIRDGEEVLTSCVDHLTTVEPIDIPPDILDHLDDDSIQPGPNAVKWFHCLFIKQYDAAKHYFVREDIYEKIKVLHGH